MKIDLGGRTALVTGASMGIGAAVAKAFAAAGANVVMLARTEDMLRALAEEAREAAEQAGERVETLPIPCDITDDDALDAAIAQALSRFGTIDILVNNAGSSQRFPFEELSREELSRDLDLKVFAAVRLAQALIPGMRAQRWGRIINVLSVNAKAAEAASAPTTMSRAAGMAMTKSMSREFAPHNILVNALCVGKIKSGQWKKRYDASGSDLSFDEFLEPVAKTIPLGRVGEPSEFANVACFLASDLASYVTGTAINVDGGFSPVT